MPSAGTAPGAFSSGLSMPARLSGRPATAVRAAAVHGQVAHVGLEAVLAVQRGDQRADLLRADLGDPAALRADQVHVCGLGRQVVARRPMPEMGMRDQAELFEQLQRPVDGGDVHPAGGLLDVGADLLGSGVLQLGHRLQHQLALWGDPVAARPQFLIPRLDHARRLTPPHPPFSPPQPSAPPPLPVMILVILGSSLTKNYRDHGTVPAGPERHARICDVTAPTGPAPAPRRPMWVGPYSGVGCRIVVAGYALLGTAG